MCYFWEMSCKVSEVVSVVANDSVAQLAEKVLEGVSSTLIKVGTFWTTVGTPSLDAGGSAANFVVSRTMWLVVALATGSIMFAGIQMMWTRRGEPARELLKSLFTLVVTSTVGVAAAQLVVTASDQFARWIMDSVATDTGGDFATAILDTGSFSLTNLTMIVVVVAGLLAVIANIAQIGLMWIRTAMLILLVGMVPLAGAATNTRWGSQWLSKVIAWFVAFAAFKPAASIVYAVAVQLVASPAPGSGADDQMVQFIMGVMMMALAVLALPALMSFIVPATGAISGGGSIAGAVGNVAATGAIAVSRRGSTGASGSADAAGSSSASSQERGEPGPAGAEGATGAGSTASASGEGSTGAAARGAGSGAGAATGAGAAGEGAAGAGAAAGPAGLAAGAAAAAGQRTADAVDGAVQTAADQTGSPSGAPEGGAGGAAPAGLAPLSSPASLAPLSSSGPSAAGSSGPAGESGATGSQEEAR